MVNIRHARIDKGWNQKELANKIGVAPASVSQWESGEKKPRKDNLERLSEVLGVSVDYLLGKENDPALIDMGGVDIALLKELQDITPKEKQKLLVFIAGLKANRAE